MHRLFGQAPIGELERIVCTRRRMRCGQTSGGEMKRRNWALAALGAILLCTSAIGAQAAVPTDTSALREAVTLEAVRAHQLEFQEFADASDGTREASTLGFEL